MGEGMKILFYDEGYPGQKRISGGQLERLELAGGLKAKGFEPILLTSTDEIANEAERRDLTVCRYAITQKALSPFSKSMYSPHIWMNYLTQLFPAVKRLLRVINKENPNIIHPNEHLARVITALASPFIQVPLVTHIDGLWNRNAYHCILRHLYLRSFTSLVAVCKGVTSPFQGKHGELPNKIRVIYPGINIPSLKCSISKTASFHKRNTESFVTVGIIGKLDIKVKGQDYLLKAIKKLTANNYSLLCLIVGEGPDETLLRNLAKKLNIQNHVKFTEYVNDICKIIREMDILVCSSLTEAFPRVVLEGMAMKKPVIGSDIGGIPEAIVDGETGYLVPPGDVDELANRLERLSANQELRQDMGTKARERVERKFSFEDGTKEIANLYRELVERSAS